jgi:hypothetical protein
MTDTYNIKNAMKVKSFDLSLRNDKMKVMLTKILLVNPPIYDFAAYDFWLKPYGMLSVAGFLRGKAEFTLFDYLDRCHPFVKAQPKLKGDQWGRGRFYEEKTAQPACLKNIPRFFRRFGLPRNLFQEFLKNQTPYDFAFVSTTMTYWYLGASEVIDDIRSFWPNTKIILGGNYVTLCPGHAEKLNADLLIKGSDLNPLWKYSGIEPDSNQPPLWEVYPELKTGILKLANGCPFNCTYCSVPKVYGKFKPRPLLRTLEELALLIKLGAKNIAFYDDAILYDAENVLIPFLDEVIKRKITVNFHTPNALNARFVTEELANLMVTAGFKTFYLGFESSSADWQKQTGSKVFAAELADAVKYLKKAGVDGNNITVYQILGHPLSDSKQLEQTMYFVNSLGVRGMLADFSPIPGTPDGDLCSRFVDMSEPLMHNKTAFPIITMGFDESNRLKDLQRKLNRALSIGHLDMYDLKI